MTQYYRLMNKSGGYTWMQTCATVVCNSKNADEQNIICVNYIISGREFEHVVMDCCQLEEGASQPVKREDNDPENGSPDADRPGPGGESEYDAQFPPHPPPPPLPAPCSCPHSTRNFRPSRPICISVSNPLRALHNASPSIAVATAGPLSPSPFNTDSSEFRSPARKRSSSSHSPHEETRARTSPAPHAPRK